MYLVTPETVRVELARHMITKAELARETKMDRSVVSALCTGRRPLTSWASHNIGLAINRMTGLMIFDVDMSVPYQKGKPGWPLGRRRPEMPTRRPRKSRKSKRAE